MLDNLQPEQGNEPMIPNSPGSDVQPQIKASGGQEIGFLYMLKSAFAVFSKKIWLFIGLSILNIAILAGLWIIGLPLILLLAFQIGTWLFVLVGLLALATLLLSWFFYGTIANQAAAAVQNLQTTVKASFLSTLKNTGKAINLTWKIFVYSGLWLIVVIMLLFAGVNSFLLFSGIGNSQSVVMILNFVLGAGGLFFIILAIIRLVRTIMAFPILMASPEIPAREALTRCKEITKKRWWLVFLFFTTFSLILGLVPLVINAAAAVIPNSGFLGLISLIISVIIALISYPLTASFFQVFAYNLANPARQIVLKPALIAVAIVLIAASVGLSFLANISSEVEPFRESKITEDIDDTDDTEDTSDELSSQITELTASQIPGDSDEERIANIDYWFTILDQYKADNGEYPETGCLEQYDFERRELPVDIIEKYFTDNKEPLGWNKTGSEAYVSGKIPILGATDMREGAGCPFVLQRLENDSIALYTELEDKLKNNVYHPLLNLQEAASFRPRTQGQYYVALKLNPSVVSELTTPQTVDDSDEARIANVDYWLAIFDKYKAINFNNPFYIGSICLDKYSLTSHIDSHGLDLIQQSFNNNEEPLGWSIKPSNAHVASLYDNCSFLLEALSSDGDSFAFYTQLDNPAKNNIDTFLESVEEAAAFQPQAGGNYYVVIKRDQPPTAPNQPLSTPTTPQKVKRN